MELKLNLNPKILERLTSALESLAANYAKVHAGVLAEPESYPEVKTRVFYADPHAYYKAELEAKEAEVS